MIWLLLPSPGTVSHLPPRYTPTIFKAHALSSRSVHHSLLPLGLFMLVSLECLFPKPFPLSVFSFSSQFKHHHLRKPSLTTPRTELGPPASPMVTRVQPCLPWVKPGSLEALYPQSQAQCLVHRRYLNSID